uniref:Indolin-2-one monooxygenase n=1 Tax=Zea mays TaxID=4577 RepID=C71C2_MAIZE|nr:RecName: Full=Indolin-2-one monooxygenase; AltName: Full=Cytochrome P450 71C2; AltName: Full=Protein benzoxazineless 3 [Zea mays]CAA57423.1 cytochrome P450 [Zea mays]CAA72208.1 cytochrome p450 [Zea mays]
MALGAAYHHYLQLAGDHGTATHALLLGVLIFLVIRLVSARRTGTTSANKRKQQQRLPLPPWPPGKLPIIGHLHLIGAETHISIRDLDAKHGRNGLLLLRIGAVPTLFVSSPSAADAVLRTQDHIFASRPPWMAAEIIRYGPSDVAFVPYGEYGRQGRKLLTTHMLSTKKVQSFRHGRQEEVRLVMDKIRAAATAAPPAAVDLSDLLSGYTNDVVSRAVLGASHRNQGRNRLFSELTEINVSLLAGFNLEDYFPPNMAMADVLLRLVSVKARRLNQRWNDVFDELIQEHVQSRPSGESEESEADFIHVLLSIQQEYGLTTDNLKAILVDMFEAGIETSYLTLEYGMAELINNRHVMEKLQTEVRTTMGSPDGKKLDMLAEEDLGSMPYLKATIKETLRLHPPAPFLLPHYSTADSEIDGYFVPAGTRVLVHAWALGRDRTTWEKPEEFMPERFVQEPGAVDVHMKGKDLRFIPFGSGRRICPGMNFGFATMEVMLANLMYHFDWEVPGSGAGVSMEESFGLTLRRKEKLLLVPRIAS